MRDVEANPDKLLTYTLDSKTLTIIVTKQPGANVASFTLTSGFGTTTGGVSLLSPTPNTPVTVYWQLGTGITSLTSEVTSTPFVYSGGKWSITFTTPPSPTVPTYALGIPFLVNFVSGAPHDPQIIVTPITGGQANSKGKAAAKSRAGGKGKAAPKRKAAPAAKAAPKRKAAPAAKRAGGKKR